MVMGGVLALLLPFTALVGHTTVRAQQSFTSTPGGLVGETGTSERSVLYSTTISSNDDDYDDDDHDDDDYDDDDYDDDDYDDDDYDDDDYDDDDYDDDDYDDDDYDDDSSSSPDSSGNQMYGIVTSHPGGHIGTWVVGDRSFEATSQTRFEYDQSHPDRSNITGICVEVTYDNANMALKIEMADAYHCSATGGDSSDGSSNDSPNDDRDDSSDDDSRTHEATFYGIVHANTGGHVGEWSIGQETIVSTPSTEFENGHGNESYGMGECVEVEYVTVNGVKTATSIERTQQYHCSNGTQTNRSYGTVTSMPNGMQGVWTIQTSTAMSITLETTPQTRMEQHDGPLAVNSCVEVVYYVQNGVSYANSIESEPVQHCQNGSTGGKTPALPGNNKVYATVDSLPDTLSGGEWRIGGTGYIATETTRLEQDEGSFAVGGCVKATYLAADGVNMLTKVETEESYRCHSQNGQVAFKGYGVLESVPMTTTYIGEWQIGGMVYQANSTTSFEQEHGFFSPGAYVEVVYILNEGSRTAMSIETHVAPNGGMHTKTGTFYGVSVQEEWELWNIDGVNYYCDPAMDVELAPTVQTASDSTATLQGVHPLVGQQVEINYYDGSDGNQYITYASSATPTSTDTSTRIFVPLVQR
jgi:hypothetical protein